MRKPVFLGLILLAVGWLWLIAPSAAFAQAKPDAQPSHADRLSSFEGPQSCAPCHANAAREVAVSLHYQQGLEPQFLVGWEKGKLAGQLSSF